MLNLLNDFRRSVETCRRLVTAAHAADANNAYLWPESDRSTVIEAAFLKFFISWEYFQESAFIEYLMGTISAAGNVIQRYATPPDRGHAAQMLVGLMRYVDWSTPDNVRKLGRSFFLGGEPFETTLASIQSDLFDLKTIRNAAAHLATNTSQQLDALASRKLQRVVSGVAVSTLLLSVDPGSVSGATIFETYIALLDAAADRIVNA
jgi:hypothetical protein